MANWTRRKLTKTALAVVSASLALLDIKPWGARAQSCGGNNYYYYDYGGSGPGGSGCGGGYLTNGGNCDTAN